MECPSQNKDGAEQIIAYAAGRLTPDAAVGFERHLARCACCRDACRAQQRVWSDLDAWPSVPVSPDFNEKVYRRISAEERSNPAPFARRLLWSWKPAMSLAAACA